MSVLPSFSVVICNFNYARFVGQAIQSALDQDYPADRLQVIVVDDGSTDDACAVYARFADDPRFLLVVQENRGQTAAAQDLALDRRLLRFERSGLHCGYWIV